MKINLGPNEKFTIQTNTTIKAVIAVRQAFGLGLRESKDLVDASYFMMPTLLLPCLEKAFMDQVLCSGDYLYVEPYTQEKHVVTLEL